MINIRGVCAFAERRSGYCAVCDGTAEAKACGVGNGSNGMFGQRTDGCYSNGLLFFCETALRRGSLCAIIGMDAVYYGVLSGCPRQGR